MDPNRNKIHSSVRSLTLTFSFFFPPFIHTFIQYHVSCAKLYLDWQFAISVAFVFGTKNKTIAIMCKYLSFSGQVPKYEFSRAIFFCLFFCFVFYTIHRLCGIYLHFNIVLYTFKNLKKSWNKKTFKPHNFSIYISCLSLLGFSSYKILPVL